MENVIWKEIPCFCGFTSSTHPDDFERYQLPLAEVLGETIYMPAIRCKTCKNVEIIERVEMEWIARNERNPKSPGLYLVRSTWGIQNYSEGSETNFGYWDGVKWSSEINFTFWCVPNWGKDGMD